jgi:RNA recognition motif-containing protein
MFLLNINQRRYQLNIYVGNLSYEVTEEELREEFTAFGEVTSASIIKDKYSGQSKGFAFVEMPLLSAGQAAINGLNGKILHNRQLAVSGARPRTDNTSRGSYGGSRGGRPDRGGGRRRY